MNKSMLHFSLAKTYRGGVYFRGDIFWTVTPLHTHKNVYTGFRDYVFGVLIKQTM